MGCNYDVNCDSGGLSEEIIAGHGAIKWVKLRVGRAGSGVGS
jgi:hypothetical protein